MTRLLLALKDPITRCLLAEELRDLLPGCSLEETGTATSLASDLLAAARRAGRPFQTIVLDAHLPGTPGDPQQPSLVEEIHRCLPETLVVHLAHCTEVPKVEERHQDHHQSLRNLPDGAATGRCQRPLYVALDQTQAWTDGSIHRAIVSQALDCLLDRYPTPLARRAGSNGPRRRHGRHAAQILAELGPILWPLAPWCDEPLVRRLRTHFGIELTSPPLSSTSLPARMFPPSNENFFLANQVLQQKEDCSPFLLHFLHASPHEEEAFAQRHGIADLALLAGYQRGLAALHDALTIGPVRRSGPIFGNADPPINWDKGRRIHVLVRNLSEANADALTAPDLNLTPYILLPHEWRCSDPREPEPRGFALAVHEATHAFNERLLHFLWHSRTRHEWEWLDEATAIYMEAALFEKHIGDACSPLWLEHMAEWVQRPFCPIVDCSGAVFCGRGSHGAMLLRHVARLHQGAFIPQLWNDAIGDAEQERPIAPALTFLVEAVERLIAGSAEPTFAEFFAHYLLAAYSIGASEPQVAKKLGPWRNAQQHDLPPGASVEFTTTEPRPLACQYRRIDPAPSVARLAVRVVPHVAQSPIRLGLAWAIPHQPVQVFAVRIVGEGTGEAPLELEIPTDSPPDSHAVLMLAHGEPQALGRTPESLAVTLEAR